MQNKNFTLDWENGLNSGNIPQVHAADIPNHFGKSLLPALWIALIISPICLFLPFDMSSYGYTNVEYLKVCS